MGKLLPCLRAESPFAYNQKGLYSRAMLTRRGNVWAGVLLAALCLCVVLAGCGGGDSSSSTQASGNEGEADLSAQFLKPGGKNNDVVKFGHEASAKDRKEAGAVMAASFEARASAQFTAQCKTLNMKAIEEIPGAKGRRDCAKSLRKFAEPLSSSELVRRDTLSGPITAMRIKGNQGFALYHGNDGKDYVQPLEKEGGSWRVSALLTSEL